MKSKCCNAPVREGNSPYQGTTSYYICALCGNACDLANSATPMENKTAEQVLTETIKKHTNKDLGDSYGMVGGTTLTQLIVKAMGTHASLAVEEKEESIAYWQETAESALHSLNVQDSRIKELEAELKQSEEHAQTLFKERNNGYTQINTLKAEIERLKEGGGEVEFPLAVDTLSKCEKPFYYDDMGQMVFDKNGRMIIDIRGWGWIQKMDNAEARQDEVGKLFTNFLNNL